MLLQLKELYTLLNENYVEDDDNMFRFDYSPEFLQWWVLLCGNCSCSCVLQGVAATGLVA